MALDATMTMSTIGRGRRKLCLVSLLVVALISSNFQLMGGGQLSAYYGLADNRGMAEWIEVSSSATSETAVTVSNSTAFRGNSNISKSSNHHPNRTTHAGNTTATALLGSKSITPLTLNITSPSSSTPRLKGTAVIQLMGEFGNHLSILAYYYAVKTIASTEYNLDLTLHVRKQSTSKAGSAAQNFKCLKSFKDLDFDECTWSNETNVINRGEICQQKVNDQMQALQDLMMASNQNNHTIMQLGARLNLDGPMTSEEIRASLRSYVSMLQDSSIMDMYRSRDVGWNSNKRHPFLFSIDRLHPSDGLIDEFYSRGLPEYFALDDSEQCCNSLPEEDEQVFHYRSFVRDLPRNHMERGYAELTPFKAAELLSLSLPRGSKIAFVTGRANRNRVEAYKEAFVNRSFVVREIEGQSSIQDFCFLAHARAGLWGTQQSSYAVWASLIGCKRMKNATLYGLNYPSRISGVARRVVTNPELARVLHYPIFDVSDKDIW